MTCASNSDCLAYQICENLTCVHKGIENPLPSQVAGWVFMPFLLAIINVGGQGGGLVKLPIYVLALKYTLSEAGMMQYLAIFGCSLANFPVIVAQRHPLEDSPLIDYNFILIIWPPLILSITLGMYINYVSPDIFVTILLNVVIIYAMYKVKIQAFQKIKEARRFASEIQALEKEREHERKIQLKEINPTEIQVVVGTKSIEITQQKNVTEVDENEKQNKIKQQKQEDLMDQISKNITSHLNERNFNSDQDNPAPQVDEIQFSNSSHHQNKKVALSTAIEEIRSLNDPPVIIVNENDPDQLKFDAIIRTEKSYFPFQKFLFMLVSYGIYFFLQLLMGTQKFPSLIGIDYCSQEYWELGAARISVVIISTLNSYFWIKEETRLKRKFLQKIIVNYDAKKFTEIFIMGLWVGLLIGSVGTGLGFFAMPYMVSHGQPPKVAAATTTFIYVLISIAGLSTFILEKDGSTEIIIFYVLLNFFGTLIITTAITYLQNKFKITYLPLLMALIIYIIVFISNIEYISSEYPHKTRQQIFDGRNLCD